MEVRIGLIYPLAIKWRPNFMAKKIGNYKFTQNWTMRAFSIVVTSLNTLLIIVNLT